MFRSLFSFLLFGFVWLFVFSIPVGHNRLLFDVGHYYFVETAPVRWLIEKFNIGLKQSESKASQAVDQAIHQMTAPSESDERKKNAADHTE